MNVGYMNVGMSNDVDCPLCGCNVYINKYGTDYKCMNDECPLSRKASVVIDEIINVMNRNWDEVK